MIVTIVTYFQLLHIGIWSVELVFSNILELAEKKLSVVDPKKAALSQYNNDKPDQLLGRIQVLSKTYQKCRSINGLLR